MIDLQVSPLMYGVLPKHDLVGMWAIDPNWIPIGEEGGDTKSKTSTIYNVIVVVF
jgi:hypothetical protein